MIRYYEQIKPIAPAHRTQSSYRTYTDNDIHTLRFIRRARDLGFSVEQMKALLALWCGRSRASADVKAIALEHIAELERKAAAIAAMTKTLKHQDWQGQTAQRGFDFPGVVREAQRVRDQESLIREA